MRTFNTTAFDDTISGTGFTWYSPARLNALLGSSESLGIQAWVGNVTGTSPTLTVQIEHSADAEHWLPATAGAPEISTSISSNASYYGQQIGLFPLFLAYVRLSVTLGGTSPQCRLKLHVTGRAIM